MHAVWSKRDLDVVFTHTPILPVNKGGDGLISNQGPIRQVDYITHQPPAHPDILLKELQKVLPC